MDVQRETIAVFGGSFDPPHTGHLLVLAYVRAVHEPRRILMVPAFKHPFGKEATASFEHRVRMCELVTRSVPGTEVSRIEEDLGGVSHTLRTVEALRDRHPGAALRLVVGADVLIDTTRWHHWESVVAIAPPIVVGRTGYPRPEACPFDLPEVSSTELRRRLSVQREGQGMLPAAVEQHILAHGLYA
jgi:nicotinate-nucleotide adenylyltransferase